MRTHTKNIYAKLAVTMAGINGLFLGYAMYRSRLVPRIIPTIGLIGAPLILMSATATIFGGWDRRRQPREIVRPMQPTAGNAAQR